MPFCDAYIPANALSASSERELLSKVTDALLDHEGVDSTNEMGRRLAWVFVHRHEMYVAGEPANAPHYRFVCHVPEGQYNDQRRAAVTAAMTQAVVEAEDGSWPHPELRVVVFTNEISDGTLGGAGRILKLPDIYELFRPGDESREAAERVLAARRRGEDWVVGGIDDAGVASALGERAAA